uniref:Uncharacterized protein n=1 Tax=Hyaloperonospora arabidopsidis (strain Emoy2) TaxID=559515 RepID=M4BC49_HYAAE
MAQTIKIRAKAESMNKLVKDVISRLSEISSLTSLWYSIQHLMPSLTFHILKAFLKCCFAGVRKQAAQSFFLGTVGTFSIPNERPLPSSAGPTHPQPDGHYLLESLGAPGYSMSGVYASTRGRAQWYRVVQLRLMCHTFFNDLGLVDPGDRTGNHWIGTAVLTLVTRGKPPGPVTRSFL